MDSQRNLFLLALLFVSFLLYQAWVVEKNPQPEVAVQATELTSVPASTNFSADVPANSVSATSDVNEVPADKPVGQSVMIENDQLRLAISLVGGDVLSADLRVLPRASPAPPADQAAVSRRRRGGLLRWGYSSAVW